MKLCEKHGNANAFGSLGKVRTDFTGALRFGDSRAMALAGALCLMVHAVTGFTNKSLRGQVAGLLATDYSRNQMTYDLRRLRLHGLIERIPHTNNYITTAMFGT